MNIPKDPILLMSVLNTKLRDMYPSLEVLCDREDISPEEVLSILKKADLSYDSSKNRIE